MFKFTLVAIAALLLVVPALGKFYDRCSLAREMSNMGVPKDQLARWACIAKHETNFDSKAVGAKNPDGSKDYGIFHINSKYWCSPPSGYSSNGCGINCVNFLVDSIEPVTKCAQVVLEHQGWTAWATWKFCDGDLPSIDDCF